jgi:hypothetical protein
MSVVRHDNLVVYSLIISLNLSARAKIKKKTKILFKISILLKKGLERVFSKIQHCYYTSTLEKQRYRYWSSPNSSGFVIPCELKGFLMTLLNFNCGMIKCTGYMKVIVRFPTIVTKIEWS